MNLDRQARERWSSLRGRGLVLGLAEEVGREHRGGVVRARVEGAGQRQADPGFESTLGALLDLQTGTREARLADEAVPTPESVRWQCTLEGTWRGHVAAAAGEAHLPGVRAEGVALVEARLEVRPLRRHGLEPPPCCWHERYELNQNEARPVRGVAGVVRAEQRARTCSRSLLSCVVLSEFSNH